ncbi:MAG TPA: LysM peptidoglycan-binding domain-containing protein, partial [Acidimicrobiales bacterium]|nr:LysM peptidoglycan-binding domain-containing protein [Acidimicrobiales bacterium]
MNHPLDASVVADSAAMAAWLAWIWIALCVVLEVVGAIRGRPTHPLPASRRLQALVATAVGASVALVPVGRSGANLRLQVAPAGVVRPLTDLGLSTLRIGNGRHNDSGDGNGWSTSTPRGWARTWTAPPPGDPTTRVAEVSSASTDTASTTEPSPYVVQRGDTLWSIAERELGSPLRWQEIALLNYGRPQPDGGALTDAHWIYPGWDLLLPGGSPAVAESSVVVAPGPSALLVPSAPRAPSAPPPPAPPGRPPIEHERQSTLTGDRSPERTPADDQSHRGGAPPRPAAPYDVLEYGVLGAGVVVLLERLRRAQRRHRPRGLRIALPADDLAALERRLRTEADPAAVEGIDIGLRALVVLAVRAGFPPPPVTMVRLREAFLEIPVDPAIAGFAPAPFAVDLTGTSWTVSTDAATLAVLRADPEIAA